MKVQLGMSLDDSIDVNDEQIKIGDLTILMDKSTFARIGDKVKVDFVEGQGITVEVV